MICFVIKDSGGFYWCGMNHWDKQLRKAKLYTSKKWATEVKSDSRFKNMELNIIAVEINEVSE